MEWKRNGEGGGRNTSEIVPDSCGIVEERSEILFPRRNGNTGERSLGARRISPRARVRSRARNSSAKGWRTCTTIKPSDLRPTLYGPRPDAPRLCEFFVDFRSISNRPNQTSFLSARAFPLIRSDISFFFFFFCFIIRRDSSRQPRSRRSNESEEE